MENNGISQTRKTRLLLISTRVLATSLAIFFSIAFLPKMVQEVMECFKGEFFQAGWEGLVMELTYFVFMVGFVISWWKKCLGGIIILLASIIQMAPFLIIDGNLGSLIFGLPMFIIGCLFVIFCIHKPS